jgi:RimK family alpha-L-glutamate ligase
VFNNSTLTRIANNKNLYYQTVCKANVKIQDTLFNYSNNLLNYPLVVKNPFGRGGNEVFLVKNELELKEKQEQFPNVTIQSYCKTNMPKDLRVYVINNKIVAAILRKGINDFRANYSISHDAEVYNPSNEEKDYIYNIISCFNIDYAGIDFLINDKNELIFNEIEDSVGARALYELTNINIAELYIKYIYNSICNKEE